MVENSLLTPGSDFYKKLLEAIDAANKKQTLELKTEIESVKTAIIEEKLERNKLEEKYDNLKKHCDKLEKALRKNNVIIFGLENTTRETLLQYAIEQLNSLLNIELSVSDINDIFYIGKQRSNKPLMIKFASYLKKQQVIKNAYKLKQINLNRNPKISISEDLSLEERNKNKILRKHLNAAKSKDANAYIKGDRLFVNEQIFTAEELENRSDLEETDVTNLPGNVAPTPDAIKCCEEGEVEEYVEEEASNRKRKVFPTNRNTRRNEKSKPISDVKKNSAK